MIEHLPDRGADLLGPLDAGGGDPEAPGDLVETKLRLRQVEAERIIVGSSSRSFQYARRLICSSR